MATPFTTMTHNPTTAAGTAASAAAAAGPGATATGTTAFANQDDLFGFMDVEQQAQYGQDDDDDDGGAKAKFQRKKDLKIYLVDAHAAMQNTNDAADDDGSGGDGGMSVFSHALKCVADTLADLIIASDTDQVGVCLYGTGKHKNSNNFPNIYVLHPLDVPDAAAIKKLRDMADATDGTVADLGALGSTTFKFDYALWVCQTMFAEVKHANTTKSIHILTNCDDPAGGDDGMLRTSVQKGTDLRATDVQMFLYKMRGPSLSPFRTANFFSAVMGFGHEKEPDKNDHVLSASTFEQLVNGVRSRRHVIRSTGTAPMYIFDEQFFVSVTVHTLVQKATKPAAINLEARTNKPVKVESSTVSEDTGEILLENQTGRRYDRYGGAHHIVFQANELKEMKDFGPAAIRLIGFRDIEELKVHHNIKHSSFLQPDEEVVVGSTKIFSALVQKMDAKGVFALASIIPRRASQPRLCALVPQTMEYNRTGDVVKSMGMHVIYLPYADDLRAPKLNPLLAVDRQVVDATKKLVQSMTVENFDCRDYNNPALQKHYKNLQTLALEEEVDEGVDDDVRPSSDLIEKSHRSLAQFRDQALGEDWETVSAEPVAGKKRKVGALSAAAVAEADLWQEYDWADQIASGTVHKLTMPVLKSYLRHHDQSTSGKKQDLLDRIQEHHGETDGGARDDGGAGAAGGASCGGRQQGIDGTSGGGGYDDGTEVDNDGWETAGNDLPPPAQRQRTQDRQSQQHTPAATLTATQSQSQTQSRTQSQTQSTQDQSQSQAQTLTGTPGSVNTMGGTSTTDDGGDSGSFKWVWHTSSGWMDYGPNDVAALEDAYSNVSNC